MRRRTLLYRALSRGRLVLMIGIASVILLGVSTGTTGESTEYGTPIRVETDSVKSMSFVKLVLRPGYSSDVWEAKDNLLSSLSLEFKTVGYNMIGTADEGGLQEELFPRVDAPRRHREPSHLQGVHGVRESVELRCGRGVGAPRYRARQSCL